ncbi:hypothetical protein EIP86_005639, partial [Pleurotus ostreatoroseus]
MSVAQSDDAYIATLETIFHRLEEESAQRAREEEEIERRAATAEGRLTAQEVADMILPGIKYRRTSRTWVCSLCATRFSGTASSLSRSPDGIALAADTEALAASTQHIWIPKQSLSKAIARRLTHTQAAHSINTPVTDVDLVIGVTVAVEEVIMDRVAEDGLSHSAFVCAAQERCGIVHTTPRQSGWRFK